MVPLKCVTYYESVTVLCQNNNISILLNYQAATVQDLHLLSSSGPSQPLRHSVPNLQTAEKSTPAATATPATEPMMHRSSIAPVSLRPNRNASNNISGKTVAPRTRSQPRQLVTRLPSINKQTPWQRSRTAASTTAYGYAAARRCASGDSSSSSSSVHSSSTSSLSSLSL